MSATVAQAKEIAQALQVVSTAEEVMGGLPVFRGTRVPIDIVLGSLEEGTPFSDLQDSYPFLTEELIATAKIYARLYPQRARPRSIAEVHPDWKVKTKKIVCAAAHDTASLHR